MEPISIAAFASAAQHGVSTLKAITEVIRASGKAEVINDLLDLQMTLMDLMQKHQELITAHNLLLEENAELRKSQEIQGALECHYNAYWLRNEDKLEGPFSLMVWDSQRKLARLHLWEVRRNERPLDATLKYYCREADAVSFVPFAFVVKHKSFSDADLQAMLNARKIAATLDDFRAMPHDYLDDSSRRETISFA